mgnify:FL=1
MTSTLSNPVSVENLLAIREIYRELRNERKDVFGGLPHGTSWLRFRYLKLGTVRTLASVSFNPPTLSIHRLAFEYSNPLLLKGLIQHELLHLVLGADIGHKPIFRSVEKSWNKYEEYSKQRSKFVRIVEESERDAGRLLRYECPNCKLAVLRTRKMKPESSCTNCCKNHNSGVWSEMYSFIRVGLSDVELTGDMTDDRIYESRN